MSLLSWTRRALVWLALVVSGCTCEDPPPLTAEDRSDGALPEVGAGRAASPVRIDGRLDESVWAQAVSTGAFVRPDNGRGDPGSQVQAEAKLAYDETHLYVAFTVYERAPTTPFSRTDVDPHLWESASGVELMLQPGDLGDNRAYYEVQIDVAGAVWDTRFDDYNHPITEGPEGRRFGHPSWSSELERAVEVRTDRYLIEVALPWTALAGARVSVPPRPGEVWRANLYSFRDGQRDALAWSPILGEGNFHRASRFGRVRFH